MAWRDLTSEVTGVFADAQELLPTAARDPQFSRDAGLTMVIARTRKPLRRKRAECMVLHLLVRDL
jgi:hypothetical protein